MKILACVSNTFGHIGDFEFHLFFEWERAYFLQICHATIGR
ncbi:hypothetical protein ACYFX5_00075 [Bremerella sp. T1]|nr:hypothetical protein [Bremerella volcania]